MSLLSGNVVIRESLPSDNEQLIKLAALTPMSGRVGLRVDRSPDFFALLNKRGRFFSMLVAEDRKGRIVGCFSATKQLFCVLGEMTSIHYLADLKILPFFKGGTLAFRLVKQMHTQLKEQGADLLFCTAAHGNMAVMNFFKGRVGIPAFMKLATFKVHQLLPKQHVGYVINDSVQESELIQFYNKFYKRYSFFPAIENLSGCTNFTFNNEAVVTAAISVSDPFAIKQNVLVHYPWAAGVSLGIIRFLSLFFKLPKIPKKGSSLRILYVKYAGYSEKQGAALSVLLQQVRHFAFDNNYHLVSIAADAKDKELLKIIRPHRGFVFKSEGLITTLQANQEMINDILKGISSEDFSLM